MSVPRRYITTVGQFEKLLIPFFGEYDVDTSMVPQDNIILPCVERQLPAIHQQFGSEISLLSSRPLCCKARSSLRTISLRTSTSFRYDLRLALACNITSALRTITLWTALIGPEAHRYGQISCPLTCGYAMKLLRQLEASRIMTSPSIALFN